MQVGAEDAGAIGGAKLGVWGDRGWSTSFPRVRLWPRCTLGRPMETSVGDSMFWLSSWLDLEGALCCHLGCLRVETEMVRLGPSECVGIQGWLVEALGLVLQPELLPLLQAICFAVRCPSGQSNCS